MKKLVPRSEDLSLGAVRLGRINVTPRGFETFGPAGQYLATFPTIQGARKALFELHRDSENGLALE